MTPGGRALLALAALGVVAAGGSQSLPRLDIEGDVLVAGLSSGAFFAVQVHTAFSEGVGGAMIFAGGPFLCAEGSLAIAEEVCMDASPAPSGTVCAQRARWAYDSGFIDSTSNLEDDRVYVFSGALDTVVSPATAGEALIDYYSTLGAYVSQELGIQAEHEQPTEAYGNPCSELGSPYLGACAYPGALRGAQAVLGSAHASATAAVNASYASFDQTLYGDVLTSSLGDEGLIYVPQACTRGPCRLLVVFHGCEQTVDDIGYEYAYQSGFSDVAEGSGLVVLYPYARRDSATGNPNGCWDCERAAGRALPCR